MALRTLAARMRTPAAALIRLSHGVFPPAAAAPSRFFGSFQGRPTYGTKDVKMLYKENLEILNGVKEQEREMNKHFRVLKGRPTYGTKDVKMLYKENLEILNGVKEHEREMNKHFRVLKVGSKCLKWSYRLLFPLPLAATVLKVTH